jgi:hypothetical protein
MGRKKPKHAPVPIVAERKSGMGELSATLLVFAIFLFICTRAYILSDYNVEKCQEWVSDLQLYFFYAARAVDLHQTPYQDNFQVEYPPLAWWTIYAPRLIDSQKITRPQDPNQTTPVFLSYAHAFRGLMFLYDLASLAIISWIVWKRSPRAVGWAALFYTITIATLAPLLYDRLDIGMLGLLMFWAFCWIKSLDSSTRTLVWTTAAYIMAGLSISYKVIPVIIVPFLLLSEFHAPRRIVRLTAALGALIAGIGLPFLIQYAISGPGVFNLFKHHAEREIQIESIYSTFMMIASLFGSNVSITPSHGAINLTGYLSHTMKILSLILLLGFLAGMGIWALLRWTRFSRRNAYCFACFVIPASVILSNVLSPQYFIWALPMLLLLAVEIAPAGKVLPWVLGALLIAVTIMTTWLFPYHYFSRDPDSNVLILMNGSSSLVSSPVAYIVLGVRNFIYLGVIIWLGAALYKRVDQIETAN